MGVYSPLTRRQTRSLTLGVAEPAGRDHAGLQGGSRRSMQGVGTWRYLSVPVSSCSSTLRRRELTLPSQDMGSTAFQETASRARRVDDSGGGTRRRVLILVLFVYPPADLRMKLAAFSFRSRAEVCRPRHVALCCS
jgi:hypothetical protein